MLKHECGSKHDVAMKVAFHNPWPKRLPWWIRGHLYLRVVQSGDPNSDFHPKAEGRVRGRAVWCPMAGWVCRAPWLLATVSTNVCSCAAVRAARRHVCACAVLRSSLTAEGIGHRGVAAT